MSRAIGTKHPPVTEEQRKVLAQNAEKGRETQIRFRGGRFASGRAVKAALEGSTGDYLATLDRLARSVDVDPRLAFEAARYLVDRVAGKPTEKIAGDADEAAVSFVAPTDAQMGLLARKVSGKDLGDRSETEQELVN